jgi:hypothetical protein
VEVTAKLALVEEMCPPEKCCCFELGLGLKIFGGLQIAMLSFYIVMSEHLPIETDVALLRRARRRCVQHRRSCAAPSPALTHVCRAQ